MLMVFLISCTPLYEYEVCDERLMNIKIGKCERFQITKIIQKSPQTTKFCDPNWKQYGAMHECENVPNNQLLSKGGTDKKYCNGHYLASDFFDNYWNAEGLIDECEMPVGSDIQVIFKMHGGTLKKHTGTIQIKIDVINYDNVFKALQIYTGENNDGDGLPDEWKYCGNVDEIKGYSTKYILCKGTNLQFVKMVNAEWNKGSLFIDNIEVLKV